MPRPSDPTKTAAKEARLRDIIARLDPRIYTIPGLYALIVGHLRRTNAGASKTWAGSKIRKEFEDWAKPLSLTQRYEKPPLDLFLAARVVHDFHGGARTGKFESTVAHRGLGEWAEEELGRRAESGRAAAGDVCSASGSEGDDILPSIEGGAEPNIKPESCDIPKYIHSITLVTPKNEAAQQKPSLSGLRPREKLPLFSSPQKAKEPNSSANVKQESFEAEAQTEPPPKRVKTINSGCQTSPTHVYVNADTQTPQEKPAVKGPPCPTPPIPQSLPTRPERPPQAHQPDV